MSRSLSQTERIGELDQRIELQKEVFTANDVGGQSAVWEKQATVWAHVRALTGREREHSDFLQSSGGYRIAIRNRSDLDVTASWRVVWRGKTLNVRFPEDNGPRSLYLIMQADSGVAT